MQKAGGEEQQSLTALDMEVGIMSYNEKYWSYNVYTVYSHVAIDTSIKFVKTYT